MPIYQRRTDQVEAYQWSGSFSSGHDLAVSIGAFRYRVEIGGNLAVTTKTQDGKEHSRLLERDDYIYRTPDSEWEVASEADFLAKWEYIDR